MGESSLLISRGMLKKGQLKGQNVLITGAGGGIGYETARSLIWLGARVIIAEINKEKGKAAELQLNREFGEGSAVFVHTDIGNEKSVEKLAQYVFKNLGKVDVIFNNATVAAMGAVHKVDIVKWDSGYNVNVRGPVLLISHFLPDMLKRNSGAIVCVPSSGAAPYMGAYEVFKTAQVELCNTLSAELEGTEVVAYSIGPGIVKTETAHKSIEEIAPLYGKTVDEFYKMSENVMLTAEEAGAGFAASVALSSRYRGLEISSIQALTDAGIPIGEKKSDDSLFISEEQTENISRLFKPIQDTFTEQIGDWSRRPIFERQWLMRDFKKLMGAAPEYFLEVLKEFDKSLSENKVSVDRLQGLPLDKIYSYYMHQLELLKGYEKNPDKVKEYSVIMTGWMDAIEKFKEYAGTLS